MNAALQPPAESSARPLDIAFFVPEDRKTGTYFRFLNLGIALVGLGHKVTVYTQTNEQRLRTTREMRDGMEFFFTPTVGGNRLLISPVNPGNIARRTLTHVRVADVYHLFQPFPSAAVQWLELQRRRPGLFAYDWDDYWMNDEFGLRSPRGLNARVTAAWIRFLEQHLPGRCDLLTTLSHGIAKLAHRWRCPETAIVYNGVWDERFPERAEARRSLGLREDALYVAMMGWSGEAEWALEALRRSSRARPRLRLAWCGKDPREALAAFPDVADRVDYLGILTGSPLRAFRASVDLGLIPMADTEFNHYRLPFKLTDFLAAGTPVLASDVGETSIVARRLPGVTACAPTREGWLAAFEAGVADLARRGAPLRIPSDWILEAFAWPRLAAELVARYRTSLALRRDVA